MIVLHTASFLRVSGAAQEEELERSENEEKGLSVYSLLTRNRTSVYHHALEKKTINAVTQCEILNLRISLQNKDCGILMKHRVV